MKRIPINSLSGADTGLVTICGWIDRIRTMKTMTFLIVRDHTGSVQVAFVRGGEQQVLDAAIQTLTPESAVIITGQLQKNPTIHLGGQEIALTSIEIVSRAETPLPLQKGAKQDARMDWRFLDLRQPEQHLIFETQTVAEQAMRQFWASEGFLEIHSPKLMKSASESGAELFRVEYFGGVACLAQSPQFYKQMAMAAGFDRVFEIGPVFRANPSFTSRHDTEFTSVDVELSWITSHEDVMQLEERWLRFVLSNIRERLGKRIQDTFGTDIVVPELPFPRITMSDARRLLLESGHQVPSETEGDLDPGGERRLCALMLERYGHEFVFVTRYPSRIRPFYHLRPADDPHSTNSFDLLWKGLEVTTGAQREHRYDILVAQAIEKGIDPETIRPYLDCFRYGMPPHGGYGFGLTRMLMVMLGQSNVREVTYVYRGPTRLTP